MKKCDFTAQWWYYCISHLCSVPSELRLNLRAASLQLAAGIRVSHGGKRGALRGPPRSVREHLRLPSSSIHTDKQWIHGADSYWHHRWEDQWHRRRKRREEGSVGWRRKDKTKTRQKWEEEEGVGNKRRTKVTDKCVHKAAKQVGQLNSRSHLLPRLAAWNQAWWEVGQLNGSNRIYR